MLHKHHCGQCTTGVIVTSIEPTNTGVITTINKCTGCGHQYMDVEELHPLRIVKRTIARIKPFKI